MPSLPQNGEWARMLLTQPPCTRLELQCSVAFQHEAEVIGDEEGIRLGQIIEKTRPVVGTLLGYEQPETIVQAWATMQLKGHVAHDSHWVIQAEEFQSVEAKAVNPT